MQENPEYDDVVADILKWFGSRIVKLQNAGVKDIIIDPGFGFGKTIKHNFEMLQRLGDFAIADCRYLLHFEEVDDLEITFGQLPLRRFNGTSVLHAVALLNGADILRVHDVKEAVQAVKLIQMLKDKL